MLHLHASKPLAVWFGLTAQLLLVARTTSADHKELSLSVDPLGPSSDPEDDHDHDHAQETLDSDVTVSWNCLDEQALDHFELSFELLRVIPPEDKLTVHFHSQQNNQLFSSLHDADNNVERTRIFLIKSLHRNACTYSTDSLEPNSFYRVDVAAVSKDGDVLKRSKFVTFQTATQALCYEEMTAEIVMGVMVIVVVWIASMGALMRNWSYMHLTKHAMHTTKLYRPKNLDRIKVVKHQCESVIYRPTISFRNRGRRISAPASMNMCVRLATQRTSSTSVLAPWSNSVNSNGQQRNVVKSLSSGEQSSFPCAHDNESCFPLQMQPHGNQPGAICADGKPVLTRLLS